jgi:hypothetical protein
VNASDHARWSEDLPALLLGGLEPERATELESHLEGCERCREEAVWLRPAVDTLPESVVRLEAPPALRERLLGLVEAAAEAGAPWAEPAAPRARDRRGGWLRRLGAAPFAWRPAAALAALALLLVAFAGYEVGSNSGGSGSNAGRAESTLTAGHSPGVTATMVREGAGGTLRLAHLHQLRGDEVLEAWVRREGRVEAVPALFVPNREGRAEATIDDMRGVDTVMVTVEPKGGSREPTSEPIVTLSIQG